MAKFRLQRKHWRTLSKRFWGTVFTLIIALAVCVQLGRQAFPLLQDYKYEISGYFGKKLGMIVEVDSLEADWSGLRPKLSLKQVLLKSKDGQTVFNIDTATIELSIISSVLNGRFSWRHLAFDGFQTRLAQDKKGAWSIPGMPEFSRDPNKPRRFSFDDPYDLFLIGRRISISDARFILDYATGESSSLFVPDISIENDFDFHRIVANVDVGEGEETMALVIEGDGDPRLDNFIANGYFELNQFPTRSVLKVLAVDEDLATSEDHVSNIRLWFQSDADKGVVLQGMLTARGQMTIADGRYLAPHTVGAEFFGTLDADRVWDLSLKNLDVQWDERTLPAQELRLNGDLRGLRGVSIAEIDVAKWADLALYLGLQKNEEVNKYLSGINPQGMLKNLNLELTDKQSGYFNISAYVVDGKSEAIMGAPAMDNLNGYIETSLTRGRFDVDIDDGLTMDMPKVYAKPLQFNKAQGQLRWTVDFDKRHFYISSSLVTLESDFEKGTGYVHLSLPFKKEYGNQALTLSLAVESTQAMRHNVYVPKTVPEDLYAWLGRSIEGGDIKNARFLYHGSVEKDPDVSPSLQLRGTIENGSLVFEPSWPRLTGLNGNLVLDNDALDVHVESAMILGNELQQAQIDLVRDPVEGGPALAISGALSGNAGSAMALLKNSPVSEYMGSTFDSWKISGNVKAVADLLVPLDPKSKGHSQRIEVNLAKATAEIPDINLTLKRVAGKLHYHNDKGIFAKGMSARVWGEKFTADIASPRNETGEQDTVISFSGNIGIDDLYAWTNRPELKFTEGKTKVNGSLFIPADSSKGPLEVSVSSDLVGVAIAMPQPFAKHAEDNKSFSSRIRFYNDADEYQFSLADQLKMSLLVEDDKPLSAIVEINEFQQREDAFVPIPSTSRFDVKGYFDSFDLEQFIAAKNQYFIYEAAAAADGQGANSGEEEELRVSYELFLNEFLLGSFAIDKLSVRGQRETDRWRMKVKSKLLAGEIVVPENESPIEMALDYVRLDESDPEDIAQVSQALGDVAAANTPTMSLLPTPAPIVSTSSSLPKSNAKPGNEVNKNNPLTVDVNSNEDAQEVASQSVLAGADLSAAVPINFATQEFSIGETDYGKWQFKLRPIEGGIVAHDIFAESKKMLVGDKDEGAEFIWLKDENGQSSQFSGVLRAGNLADVFAAWEQEKLLESESARIVIDAQWSGAPDEVTLKDVEGLISLDVQRGSFTRGAGSDENGLLRLIALFNFDTIVRRLRLDFSDLTAEGYSFDSVEGKLVFRDGIIYLTEPLIVKSSSSDTQLAGTVDLIDEKLDAEMVVTLPVASNIAVATALVVGLPAALGVYVMSKLFKKQVDRASSLNISVTGDWEDPKVNVKKIFDIDAAERRSKKLKDDSKKKASEDEVEAVTIDDLQASTLEADDILPLGSTQDPDVKLDENSPDDAQNPKKP